LARVLLRLEEKQAAAAVGQIRLAQAWAGALAAQGLTAAQLLLTLDDTEDRRRYLNARATLTTLLGLRCIPVINENDTVATTEIRFGDNDRLAARVAEMLQADVLVLLSDIDGLYTADPRRDAGAAHIPLVAATRLFLRRHAHQAGGGADRDRCGLCDGDYARCHAAPAARAGGGGALHLVPAHDRRADGAQELDCRASGAGGYDHHRCRGGAGAAGRLVAPAGGCCGGYRAV
jgi:hypothetical protein